MLIQLTVKYFCLWVKCILFYTFSNNRRLYVAICEYKKQCDELMLQRDDVPVPMSSFTKNRLSTWQVTCMVWPAKCSSLNPAENLWATTALKVNANSQQLSSIPKLKNAVAKEWVNISLEQCYNQLGCLAKDFVNELRWGGKYTKYYAVK